jgi:hypothetical protein
MKSKRGKIGKRTQQKREQVKNAESKGARLSAMQTGYAVQPKLTSSICINF